MKDFIEGIGQVAADTIVGWAMIGVPLMSAGAEFKGHWDWTTIGVISFFAWCECALVRQMLATRRKEGFEKGRDEGFEAGREEGYTEGYEAGLAETIAD